jgi:flagellar hook assembly protein FlgD
MTSVNPVFSNATAASAASASSNSASNTARNTLGPDAFITLLTAQLQAQDPLSPMDPNQMVSELTSMNTLQQIIQIRQDLDALAGAVQAPSTGSGSGNGAGASTTALNAVVSRVSSPEAAALQVMSSVAASSTQSGSKSQLF